MKLLKSLFVFYLMIILSSPILAMKRLSSSAEAKDNAEELVIVPHNSCANSPKMQRKQSDLATYLLVKNCQVYVDSPCGNGNWSIQPETILNRPGSPAQFSCCPHCP